MADPHRNELESDVKGLKLKEEEQEQGHTSMSAIPTAGDDVHNSSSSGMPPGAISSKVPLVKRASRSPMKTQASQSPAPKVEDTTTVGGDVTIKQEPGKPLKLARSTSQKVERRAAPLYLDWEDKTKEATSGFEVIKDCSYANKYLGATDPALECDCSEEWDATTHENDACGEDSDCINRATKMECAADCGCGNHCRNQRFTHKQYADVSVIKTEKKGYGLRANTSLHANEFIFEYIGEVIGEAAFRRRMQIYDEEGIKHFYFMSLTKGEFVDATRKGNLGRFCNHSCNPNCYVDKWVVGDKLRMGIFAERKIKAGEELVFNYNVDRYGADPQPCYCGEPNCTGYIGGKTQTERSTKLSKATIEALGIEDADAWDTAVAKKPRKKKSSSDDDEDYVNNLEPKELEENGVRSVMAQLPQCKEAWIVVKLLNRIQRASSPAVLNQVVRMHGYRHLKTALGHFMEDVNICLQILDVLHKLPRITRNKIQDSKIEDAVQQLVTKEDERVATQSRDLLDIWSKLEIGYRIPRMKRDPNATPTVKTERVDRRDDGRRRSKSRSRTLSPVRVNAPNGPRNNAPRPRPPPRYRPPPPPSGPLPTGWFEAQAPNGATYYYNQSGTTSWQRPAAPPGPVPAPPPPKAVSDQQLLQDLIQNIVAAKKEPDKPVVESAPSPKQSTEERKEAKLRALSEEKQKKVYEALIQPHVQHVVNKFKHKLEKDDLKRLAKDISKKIVNSDFKNDQVKSLAKLSDRHAKKVKKHVHETFEKAVHRKREHDKKKQQQQQKSGSGVATSTPLGSPPAADDTPSKDLDVPVLSDDEDDETPAVDAQDSLKRAREDGAHGGSHTETASKRLRADDIDDTLTPDTPTVLQPPPPPPPPPPAALDDDATNGALDQSVSPASKMRLAADYDLMQIATPPTTESPSNDGLARDETADHRQIHPDRLQLVHGPE